MPPELREDQQDSQPSEDLSDDTGADTTVRDADDGGDDDGDSKGNGERLFTQAELDEIVAKRLKKERRKGDGRSQKQKGQKPGGNRQSAPEVSDVDVRLMRLDLRDALDDLDISLPRNIRKIAETLLEAKQPDDMDEFIEDYVRPLLGNSAEGETQTKPKNQGATSDQDSEGDVQRTRDRGGARAVRDFEDIDNPNDLTAADIARLRAKHGVAKANDIIRNMAENWMRGKRFSLQQPR